VRQKKDSNDMLEFIELIVEELVAIDDEKKKKITRTR